MKLLLTIVCATPSDVTEYFALHPLSMIFNEKKYKYFILKLTSTSIWKTARQYDTECITIINAITSLGKELNNTSILYSSNIYITQEMEGFDNKSMNRVIIIRQWNTVTGSHIVSYNIYVIRWRRQRWVELLQRAQVK